MSQPVLYSYFRSTCSWRVRIALALKGIDYEYKPVNLLQSEQRSDEYNQINPQKLVPSLVIDGHTLVSSVAIMEYLDETRGAPYILPRDDPFKRHKVRVVTEMITSDIQPVQNLRILQYVGAEKKAEWGRHWIETGFKGVEGYLQKTAGKYCVGDEITMADICLIPQIYNANRFKVDMSQFPTITRIQSTLADEDAFKKAHPSNQPDCPPELR